GVAVFVYRSFTYIAVLLNSAELICKRLSSVVLPEAISDVIPVKKSKDIHLDSPQSKKSATGPGLNSSDGALRKPTFPEHLERILQRNTCMPLIRSSKGKDSAVSAQELEMLLNS